MPGKHRPVLERFLAKIEMDDTTGCWLWTAGLDGKGYGQIGTERRGVKKAYRWAYEYFIGPVPAGLELDHLCRVKHCCAPWHLEPVTHAENRRRSRKTHCVRGHALTPEHLYTHPVTGYQSCRLCSLVRNQEARAKGRRTP